MRVGLDEGGFPLLFEFMHECVSRALILELPKIVLHAFENQRIDRELHTFADTQCGRGIFGEAKFGLQQLIHRGELERGALDLE